MTAVVAGLALGVSLAAGLWPFADRPPVADRATVGSLNSRSAEPLPRPAAPVAIGDETAARERAMAQYQQFLALEAGPEPMRREAMRRLADLNMEAGAAADAEGTGADASVDAAAVYYREAVRLYGALLAFADTADREQVLYQLSRAQDGAGDGNGALASLDRLALDHPVGRNADEAQFRRAETYFIRQDYASAEKAYAAVLASGPASSFHEQSLYKHGWALFKQGRHEEGLASFLPLLDLQLGGRGDTTAVQARLDAMGRAERELIDDTLRVTAITLEYTGGAPAIPAALATAGDPAWSWLVYQAVGDLYLEKQRYRDAAEAYVAYVDVAPDAEPAPALQQAAIDAYAQGKFPTLVLTAKQQYVERYGLDGSWWQLRGGPGAGGAVGERVTGELKTHLSDLAEHDHAVAQQSKAPGDYARAADWYRRYLAYFPDDPEAAQRSFLLGELQFEARQFGEARDAYLRAAYAYPGYPKAPEAGYAALLAAREQERLLAGEAQVAWHAETREQALAFAAAFPGHPEAGAVLTNVAEDLFAGGDLARAEQVAGLVLTLQPPATPDLERIAWTVTAHAQFDLGRYADAEGSYLRLRSYALPTQQRGEVDARIAASVYRQGEQAAAEGRVDQAVQAYLRVAEVVPDADIRPNALYDAATLLLNNRRWGEASDLLQQFRREFPAHRFNSDVTAKLAVVLREDGRAAEAAAEYERIAGAEATGPDLARESLWQAAELYARAGATADESRVYEGIVARFPAPFAEAQEARQKLADLAEASSPQRQRWLQAVVAADATAGAARTDRSRYLAARASLELARPVRDAFVATTLTMPLKQSLQLKKKRMEEALGAYSRAAAFGVGEVTTAATYETGEIYYQLSRDLLASQRPADLDAEALEQYDLLLEEQAFPFEEKAQELYRANVARAAEGVWDEWVQASYARLAAIAPARYAREERSTDVATWID